MTDAEWLKDCERLEALVHELQYRETRLLVSRVAAELRRRIEEEQHVIDNIRLNQQENTLRETIDRAAREGK